MPDSNPLTLALLLSGALAAAMGLYAWPRKRIPGARAFAAINFFAALASWSYAANFLADDPGWRELWLRMRFSAQTFLPLGVLILCLELAGQRRWISGRRLAALIALPVAFLAIGWTNHWHHLFIRTGPVYRFTRLAPLIGGEPGPLFWPFVVYSAVAMILGTLLLVEQSLGRGGVARGQAFLLLAGLVFPEIASLASLAGAFKTSVLLGPFAYSVTLAIFGFAIFRLGFLDIVPIARAAVFDDMSQGVVVLDGDGRVVDANAAAATLLGSDTIVRRSAAAVFAPFPAVVEALDADARVSLDVPRGGSCLEIVVTPLSREAPVPGRLVMINDVTETRRAEAALRAASNARGDFLARMSHEIRTPMNGAMGLSGLLLQTPLDDRQREYARGVRQSVQALLRVVNDVLDFSRIDAGRLALEATDFEPRRSVAEAMAMVRTEAQAKGLSLRTEVDADVPFMVSGDAGRLRQVLVNLLANAVKFTATGEVGVSVSLHPPVDDGIMLRLSVTDMGIGIAPGALERIFQPFEQAETSTASRYGGSGLGLAICKQLVELMGGRIEARSEVGRGSVFMFTVRVARPGANAVDVTDDADERAPLSRWSGRVLVAEDNTVNTLVIVQMLEARGIVADVAASGVEAVEAWARVPYDLVLMDCRMPDMDGYEAAREIRRRETVGRHTPIVAMTADALVDARQRCLAAGMDEHVAKPVRARDLDAVLSRFLAVPETAVGQAISGDALDEIRAAMGRNYPVIVQRYLDDAGASIVALRAAVVRGDERDIEHVAHRLKGSSGIVAATTLARLCQRFVDDPREPASTLDQIENELGRVREQLQATLERA